MDSYILSGDTPIFDGADDTLAGEDLGFLPFLASAVAPRLISAAIPLAQRALAKGGAAQRLTRAVSSNSVRRLSKGIRLPNTMVQRATNAIAEGQSPTDAFISTFASPDNAEQESELLGALNASNPLARIISFVRSKLPLANEPLKSAVRDTAQNTVTRPLATPVKSYGLVKVAQSANKPTTNQAMIAKPLNPYVIQSNTNTNKPASQSTSSSSGGSGAGGTWDYAIPTNTAPYTNNQIPTQNFPSQSNSTGSFFDDDLFLMMMLMGNKRRRRRKRSVRRNYYRKYYRRSYRPYSRPTYRRYYSRNYKRRGY